MFHGTCFVLHQPGEGQFGISRPVFCLSPPPMKDNLALPGLRFVFHHLDDGQFLVSRPTFCPSLLDERQFGVIRPVFCPSSPR